jgi:hypothetical protein
VIGEISLVEQTDAEEGPQIRARAGPTVHAVLCRHDHRAGDRLRTVPAGIAGELVSRLRISARFGLSGFPGLMAGMLAGMIGGMMLASPLYALRAFSTLIANATDAQRSSG